MRILRLESDDVVIPPGVFFFFFFFFAVIVVTVASQGETLLCFRFVARAVQPFLVFLTGRIYRAVSGIGNLVFE